MGAHRRRERPLLGAQRSLADGHRAAEAGRDTESGADRNERDCQPPGASLSGDQQRRGRESRALARRALRGGRPLSLPSSGGCGLRFADRLRQRRESPAGAHRNPPNRICGEGIARCGPPPLDAAVCWWRAELLGLAGGALGIALTFAGIRLFRGLAGDFPNADAVNVNVRVLLFTMAVSFATAIVVGSAPAFQAARTDLNLALREGRHATTTGTAGRRTRHILAVSEIALAMVLLVGAGLMINSVLRMQQVNPGFDPANVINFDLSVAEGAPYVERLPGGDIERATPLVSAFYRQLLDKVTAIPGVESAGTVTPFGFGYNFSVLGCPLPPPDKMPITGYKEIKPHFVPNVENSAEKGPLSERLRPGRRAVGRGRQRDFRTTLLPKRRSHRPAITAEIY